MTLSELLKVILPMMNHNQLITIQWVCDDTQLGFGRAHFETTAENIMFEIPTRLLRKQVLGVGTYAQRKRIPGCRVVKEYTGNSILCIELDYIEDNIMEVK